MLNNTQRQMLETIFKFLYDSIKAADVKVAVAGLKAIFDNEVYNQNLELFKEENIIQEINRIREIYNHPCPQNKVNGSPYVRQVEGFAVWEPYGHGNGIAQEPLGLLNLTGFNDQTCEPVTDLDVQRFIQDSANKELAFLQSELINIQEKVIGQLLEQIQALNEICNERLDIIQQQQERNEFLLDFTRKLTLKIQASSEAKQLLEEMGILIEHPKKIISSLVENNQFNENDDQEKLKSMSQEIDSNVEQNEKGDVSEKAQNIPVNMTDPKNLGDCFFPTPISQITPATVTTVLIEEKFKINIGNLAELLSFDVNCIKKINYPISTNSMDIIFQDNVCLEQVEGMVAKLGTIQIHSIAEYDSRTGCSFLSFDEKNIQLLSASLETGIAHGC